MSAPAAVPASVPAPVDALPPEARRELAAAVAQLEHRSFVASLAQYAGTPVDFLIKVMPKSVNARLRRVVTAALFRCLEAAINALDEEEGVIEPPSPWMSKVMTGVTGGVGGFFGPWALPLELPVTTALMLRGIAEIARDEGEDVRDAETLLACLEVFALGGGRSRGDDLNLEYYAVRAALTELTREAGRHLMERGAINATSPIMARLVGEIVSRFGFAVGDRFASGIVPVIGAVGGAAVNMIFMDHFQRMARGHFTVRRLERRFGPALVRAQYRAEALNLRSGGQAAAGVA